MSVRNLFKRVTLLLFLAALLFVGTACNRKDNGITPTQSPIEVPSQASIKPSLLAIEAATGPVNLDPLPENPPPPEVAIAMAQSGGLSPKIMSSAIKMAVAPNPSGPNLAQSAIPSASSVWPNTGRVPALAIDGNLSTYWMAIYWTWNHWYQLSWGQPVTISRIFMTKDYGHAAHVMQTVQSITYYSLTTSSWQTIPGSSGTFSGGAGDYDRTFAPITTTGIRVNLNTGPTNPHPNWTVWLDEIEVYGASVTPKISKIEFSGAALNKIYDRKNHQFLDPPHWSANIQSGQITETRTASFSYVINNPLSLKPEFVSEDGTPLPANYSFDIELIGKVKDLIGNEPVRTITFPSITWPNPQSDIIISDEALHTKVGIWGLELNWVFKKNGSQIGNQRTPKASTYHCVFTTWQKPLITGNFGRSPNPSSSLVEQLPTFYLEILKISCSAISGFTNANTAEQITIKNLDWLGGQNTYSYAKVVVESFGGLDKLLNDGTGMCWDFAWFLQALVEVQGVDVRVQSATLTDIDLKKERCLTTLPGVSFPAVGNVYGNQIFNPKFGANQPLEFGFSGHVYVVPKFSSQYKAYDPTFNSKYFTLPELVNITFDVSQFESGLNVLKNLVSYNPHPDFVDPTPFLDWD